MRACVRVHPRLSFSPSKAFSTCDLRDSCWWDSVTVSPGGTESQPEGPLVSSLQVYEGQLASLALEPVSYPLTHAAVRAGNAAAVLGQREGEQALGRRGKEPSTLTPHHLWLHQMPLQTSPWSLLWQCPFILSWARADVSYDLCLEQFFKSLCLSISESSVFLCKGVV